MKGFNLCVPGIAGPVARAARCYTQQIFCCSASGIDRDTSLSDYRDGLAVCV